MQKAFVQYLRSLSQSGLSVVPKGDEHLQKQLEQAIQVTGESIAEESEINRSAETQLGSTPIELRIQSETSPPTPQTPKTVSADTQERLRILSEQVSRCEKCPELVANRRQTVFGVGDPYARLCFMGEAPGADEDAQGEPFVGAAGQLLNRIITACKMKREEVYILNTLKCRPPNNRNPADGECQNCRPFLDEQLSILQPEYICCLGGIAAKHLLDSPLSVGKLRGKLHLYQGIPVVVTYHPAYLLRNPDAKRQVWDDMKFLMGEMGHSFE